MLTFVALERELCCFVTFGTQVCCFQIVFTAVQQFEDQPLPSLIFSFHLKLVLQLLNDARLYILCSMFLIYRIIDPIQALICFDC